MIVCDVCLGDGKQIQANRYIFPLKTLDAYSRVEIPESFSVDLCDRHAGEFRAMFMDLIEEFSLHESPPREGAKEEAVSAWVPTVGKTYGRMGDELATVREIIPPSNKNKNLCWVRFETPDGRGETLSVEQFAERFGMMKFIYAAPKKGKK